MLYEVITKPTDMACDLAKDGLYLIQVGVPVAIFMGPGQKDTVLGFPLCRHSDGHGSILICGRMSVARPFSTTKVPSEPAHLLELPADQKNNS